MTPPPYTLSFTVGGLFLFEGIALAKLRAAGYPWDEVRHAVPAGVFVARGGASSVKRIRNEVVGRLTRLTDPEIAHLASAGMTDARALMWVAACRKYRILAEFAREVLDERLRTFQPEIRVTDFDALLDAKGVHAEEIARLSPSTRARLRSGAFSFDTLLGPWLDGAAEITLTDPYIRVYHQMRNLMELLEVVALRKPDGEDVRFNLLTAPDPEDLERQAGYLEQIRDGIAPLGVEFTWTFDGTSTIHARHLVTDTGWKILLDRGLDVFQRADLNNGFSPANRHQRFRPVKAFEVTYLHEGKSAMGSPRD